ncbi:MAG: hypothetical protein ACXWTH_06940 [Methylosarcina sp.]
MTMDEVKGFLTFLTVDRKVAASSQNQAFNACCFCSSMCCKRSSVTSKAWCEPSGDRTFRWCYPERK